ncbi:MAG: Eco57I restriction-modification methylase domain-containing protein [Candidatus Pacebacteria bacterium]|nr:Eco57I restriction-modification methylase domain-containing protein [Candidatus Paceibacterota bacterium]
MINLNKKYKHEDFVDFLGNFLPEDFNEKEEDILIKKERYKEITKAKVLGFSESLDLHVLEMDHSHENDPRITIATDAFKILADHWIHQALVVFKNKDSENYRLSYLTISLDINDKNKTVKKYSNARRYSFYLGVNAKIKTPEQQLLKKGRVKDINDLLSRFSVEVVNKQFYLEVAKFFDELVSSEDQNLALPGISHEDSNTRKSFAVRLIGRIMFCWFLKQKKSDNGQLISDELLSSKIVSNDYYHSILEPLFFAVLNTNIDSRDIRSDLFDKVPYLNGGLFNPQLDDYYELDRGTFSSRHINTLKISDSWFSGFFELLETYNFTIDENTVFDQELSVDPEMLGRIFENLLAEINPETGSSERNRTGSFYTPRPIVEYMVDQSLIEYLKIKTKIDDKKISALISYDSIDDAEHPLNNEEKQEIINAVESLKILDPACGSGAYPIGALQKIVYILQRVDPDCKLWLEQRLKGVQELYKQKIMNDNLSLPFNYTRKLDIIRNSIFGVDIQPIAVDVSRLRCFLTLVVESEIDDTKSNRGIIPLPNLDFKFICANSLIPAPEQASPDSTSLFKDDFQEKLSMAVDKYFSSSGENKRSANNEIHKLIDNKIDEKLKHLNNLVSYNGDKKMESILAKTNKKKIDHHSSVLLLWSSYKNIFENKPVGFFDPKYFFPSIKDGFDIVIGNPPYFVYQGHSKNEIEILKEIDLYKKAQGGKLNAFKLFLAKGADLLKNKGVLSFIFQNSFLADNGSKKIRQFFLNEQRIISIDSFPERDNAKKRVFESVKMSVCIMLAINEKVADYSFVLKVWEDKDRLNGWKTLFSNKELLGYDSIAQQIPYLKDNEKLIFKTFFLKKDLEKIKCYEGELNMTFHKHLFSKNLTYPKVIKGAQVQRYFLTDNMSQGEVDYVDEEKYLSENKGEKSFHHESDRIAIQGITGANDKIRIIAAIVPSGCYIANSCNYIFNIPTRYTINSVLGILNSKFINWIFRKTSTNSNVNTYEISNLSFPKIDTKSKNIIINKISDNVEKILVIKNNNNENNTKEIEFEIDELVMDLYELTEQEKEIISNN